MRYLISTICIALLLWGCDNSTSVSIKPTVVRKKIVTQKDQTAKVRTKKTVRTAERKPTAKQQTKTVVAKANTTLADAKKQPASKVVRKKIVIPKDQTAEVRTKKTVHTVERQPTVKQQTKTVGAKTNMTQADAKKQPASKKIADSGPLIVKKIINQPVQNEQPNPVKQKKPAISPKSEITEIKLAIKNQTQPGRDRIVDKAKLKASEPMLASNMALDGIPSMYDPTGKIDPFEPLFKEKPVVAKGRKRLKRAPQTPLERIDLSQLKLVGIILASSGNRALVEESSGKGYVIKSGTYIGTNGGKIVKIKKEIITIEEKFEDVFGKIQSRQKELKLPKPPGEF